MRAGQTKRYNGHEVMLFPFDEMYISQGEHGGYCLDFVGWSPISGQIAKYPYYAPCTCICVFKSNQNDYVIFNSINKVWIPGYTEPQYVCWQQGHDDTPCNVGDTFFQGELIGHTGTTGQAAGDHCHYNTALGHYDGWASTQLKNSIHIYDCCYIDDTTIYRDLGYPWKTFGETPTTQTSKKKNFPWVLYAKKLRNMRLNHNNR